MLMFIDRILSLAYSTFYCLTTRSISLTLIDVSRHERCVLSGNASSTSVAMRQRKDSQALGRNPPNINERKEQSIMNPLDTVTRVKEHERLTESKRRAFFFRLFFFFSFSFSICSRCSACRLSHLHTCITSIREQ
jgi:hypothetical protein